MRAGLMDKEITVQRFTSTVNDYGTPLQTWTDVASVRAQRVQASTEEFIRGAGATDKTIAVFRTYWVDVTTADRVLFSGQNFNIKETKEIGRRAGLELRCEAIS